GVGGDVTGAAEALVSLRAMRGKDQDVALLPPEGAVHELVDVVIGALEVSGARHVRMNHDSLEVVGTELPGPPLYFGVSESMAGQGRFEKFPRVLAGKRDAIGRLSSA